MSHVSQLKKRRKRPKCKFLKSRMQRERADYIVKYVEEHKTYWPLSLRQIYYYLFSHNILDEDVWRANGNPAKGKIKDPLTELSKLVKWLRIDGDIQLQAIGDKSRRIVEWSMHDDMNSFLQVEIEYFLDGYSRNLMQEQENYIEIWIESDALLTLFKRVASRYCIPIVVAKGFSSVTYKYKLIDRAKDAKDRGQKPVILCFSDFNPSGCFIFEDVKRTIREDIGYRKPIDFVRCALTQKQCKGLATNPSPIKRDDPRRKAFVKKYKSEKTYELDAMHPQKLTKLIERFIKKYIDMEEFKNQKQIQAYEQDKLYDIREKIREESLEEYIDDEDDDDD